MLYKVVLTFESVDEIQKAWLLNESYYFVVLLIMPYKVVFTCDSVDEILKRESGEGGTQYIFGWECAAGTLRPPPYARPFSADFATLY